MAAASNALEALFRPITPHQFVHEYWGKKTLFVPGTEAKIHDMLGGMIGWDDYFEVADQLAGWRHQGKGERADSLICSPAALAHRDRVGGFLPLVLVEADCARDYLNAGIPVTIPYVHWFHRAIREFMIKLTSEVTGLKNAVAVFATNPYGGHGVSNHFDSTTTLHIQLLGRKRWKVSMEPELAWPPASGVETTRGCTEYMGPMHQRVERRIDPSELTEIEVKPGDVLFMPAGTWHQAEPLEEDTLGLELLFGRLSATDVLLHVLHMYMQVEEGCRADPPLILADEAPPWSMPEEARRFFSARIEELQRTVARLSADDMTLHRVWKGHANGHIPRLDQLARQPIRMTGTETRTERGLTRHKPIEVTPDTELEVSERGPVKAACQGGDDCDRIYLFQQDSFLELEGVEATKFAQRMVESQKSAFRAADATSWGGPKPLDWEPIKRSIETLVEHGFLTVKPNGADRAAT